MRALLIGGSGFLGSGIAGELLERGVELAVLDPAPPGYPATRYGGDVRDPALVDQVVASSRPDVVVHLAALLGEPSEADPAAAYRLNLGGTVNVLEACRVHAVPRLAFMSSVSVYGNVSGELLTEDSPRVPISVYGMTKLAGEFLGGRYRRNWGLEFVAIRPAHGYGPGRLRGHSKDGQMARHAVAGQPFRAAGAAQTYEPVYVKDTARAVASVAVASRLNHDAYNVGIGRRLSLEQIAEIVRRLVPGADIQLEPGFDKQGSDRTRTDQPPTDISRLRQDLGWTPRYQPEEGIADFIESLRSE